MAFGKYNILTTPEQIQEFDEWMTKGNFSRISVDTETNGLHFWKHVVIGISISVDSKSGFYIPFLTWVPDETSEKPKKVDKIPRFVFEKGDFKCIWTDKHYPENVSKKDYNYPEFILKVLKKHLTKSNNELIMHNAPFDVLFIEASLGFDLAPLVYCDTVLLKHVIDENSSNGLKETAILWSDALGIPVEEQANKEQREMGDTVIRNGGTYNKKNKHIWRADLDVTGKYAIADTFLTFGLFEVGLEKLKKEFTPKHMEWFFEDEVMPLCREVVIPMKKNGVPIDVEYFKEMEQETREKMEELEDDIIRQIEPYITDFDIGTSVKDVVTKRTLVDYFIEKEGLEYPKIAKGKKAGTPTLGKKEVQQAFAESMHWLWGYLLGENELEISEEELKKITKEIYFQKTENRHHFNISSDMHLRWLFCDKLGVDKRSLPQTDSATKDKPIPSMKATVLKEFFFKKYEFIKPLLLFKKLQKLHSTYILPALALNNNGVLHMDFMQSGTVSGRFACRGGFNLQTLPKVEELDRCYKCGSKDVLVVTPIKLVGVMACHKCGHEETDIVCPSAIKKGFIAPKGFKIVNADYSSLEPRCFAFMSGDPKLKEIYTKNLDLYSKVYCDMEDPEGIYSPDPKAPNFLKKMDSSKRTMVKPVVLGIPYGALDFQTARLMNFKKMVYDKRLKQEIEVVDVEKGKEFRDKYLNTYPNLKNYMITQDNKACTDGFVETIVGRRRHFKFTTEMYRIISEEGVNIEEFMSLPRKLLDTQSVDEAVSMTYDRLKAIADRCGFKMVDEKKKIPRTWAFLRAMFKNELNNSKNFPIQGLGAHIANRAMLEMTRMYREQGLKAYVALQVHDEITSYAPLEEVELTAAIKQHCMENNKFALMVDIPMEAEPIIADNLKDAK